MKRFKKELSWLLAAALVVSSLFVGIGQLTAAAVDATGTGVFRLDIRIDANDTSCNGNATKGTDSQFRLQLLNAGGTVISQTPDGAITGAAGAGVGGADPLENNATTSYTFDGANTGANVHVAVPSLATLTINRTVTQMQLVCTNSTDDWTFADVRLYYAIDGGTNWVQITSGGWGQTSGAVTGTWSVGAAFTTTYVKTLTFNANGGSPSTTLDAIAGQTITSSQATTPSQTGYTFAGWSGVPARMPNAAATYYAAWNANTYTVAYNANGGTGTTSSTGHTYNATNNLAANNFSYTGYTFYRWNTAANGSGTNYTSGQTNVGNLSSTQGATVTLYAIWTINSHQLTVNPNGGVWSGSSSAQNFTQNYNTTKAIGAPDARTGYTFNGWTLSGQGSWDGSMYTFGPTAGSTATLTAQWSINSYTITFDGNGGSTPSPITQNYGTTVTAPANPTRTGYTFAGWSPAVPGTMPANNTTCVAQWTLNSYTITWAANGGTGGGSNTATHGATPTPIDPGTRTGYTFTGWSPAIVPATGPATYTAQWSVNSYTIFFDEAGGSAVADITQNYGTTVTAPANPTRTGYTFAGWSPSVPSTMPAGNTTCVAQWTINQYTISFNSNGGSAVSSITQNYNTAVTAPANPTRTGYSFTGWSPAVPSTMPANNTTCVAQRSVNSYSITFDANGGTGGTGPTSMVYGSALSAPTVTRIGYTFSSWSPSVPSTVPAANTTYVAQWTINQYTVSFNSNGGSAVGSITQNYNTSVAEPAAPTKTGNNFAGWYSDAGLTSAVTWPYTLGAANVTFYAKWVASNVNITFDANGGTGGTGPTSMQIGATLTAPTVTRTGYTFNAWSPTVPATVPGTDTTYTAQWTINSYNLTFDANGGTGGTGPTATEYGAAISPPTVTRTGYTFTGWDPAVAATMPAEDTTYTAQWTINSYNLTFDANGGTGGTGPTATEYGAAISPPTVTRTFYTFAGWDPEVPATMPAADTVYTALWTADPIELVPADASTTVIDQTDMFIYGLTEGMTQADFESDFVDVLGNGRLEITTLLAGEFGTGTKVELINNENDEVVATYYIVIFGDLSGDGVVGSTDADIINNYENFDINWDPATESYLFKAGDLNGDGNAEAIDADIVNNCENFYMWIDQTTGLAYAY